MTVSGREVNPNGVGVGVGRRRPGVALLSKVEDAAGIRHAEERDSGVGRVEGCDEGILTVTRQIVSHTVVCS